MAENNSSYDYILQNNPHNPNNQSNQDNPNNYYNYTNTARAIDREEIPVETPEARRASDINMKKSPEKKGSAIKVFFVALLVLAMISTVLYGNVETNRMYRQISEKNNILENAQSENVRLKSELESKMTLKNIEEYATKVLGLQKLDSSQIKYVKTQTDDIIEIPEEESDFYTKIKNKFEGLMEYIFG